MERACENCDHSELETDIDEQVYYVCGLGTNAFMECQIACTDDHFEEWNKHNI